MGTFIAFEGIDGAGKSTQIQRCVAWLESRGTTVVTCRDPGTTVVGERLRQLVVDGQGIALGPECETLVYMAARAQLVREVIRPSLERGHWVVSDRFLLSNVVYQGYGFGLATQPLWQVGAFATGGCLPDVSIVLDVDPETAAARRVGEADRMESRDRAYFLRLREGFLAEAARAPQSIKVVDATRSESEVHVAVQQAILGLSN